MDAICEGAGISRQAHYQKKRREEQAKTRDGKVLTMVRMVRRKHPRMGTRKLLVKIEPMLAQEGIRIGRDSLFELLRENGMLVSRKRRKRRTTWPGVRRMPNLLAGTTVSKPDMAWVADITYLEMASGGYKYLFLVMDLYSRKVVGWILTDSLESGNALGALKAAVEQAKHSVAGLIHHSDHGSQYSSRSYLEYLDSVGIAASMGEVGNAYDNAYAERVLGTLKREYGLDSVFRGSEDVGRAVSEAMYLYNVERPHQSLGYATPAEVYLGQVEAGGVLVRPAEGVSL